MIGVNFFRSRNIGQEIQEEVNFHDHKKGTPTMGGLFIVFGTIAGYSLSHINFWTIGEGFKSLTRHLRRDLRGGPLTYADGCPKIGRPLFAHN